MVLASDEADLGIIFDNSTDDELGNQNFFPQIPPQLKANRSILLTKLNKYISDDNEEQIRNEIKEVNYWVTRTTSIHKFPSCHINKITFSDTHWAKKAQDVGLKTLINKNT